MQRQGQHSERPYRREWKRLTGADFARMDRARTIVMVTCSPLEVHGPHLPGRDRQPGSRVFAPRIARDPLPGDPVRPLYLPAGVDDPGFSNRVYAAMALASGVEQAGDVRSPVFPETLALAGLAGDVPYPVAGNVSSRDGRAYTGVVAQYRADGVLDAHHVFAQLDEVKVQYGCFFATFAATGGAVVPAPQALEAPCPQ